MNLMLKTTPAFLSPPLCEIIDVSSPLWLQARRQRVVAAPPPRHLRYSSGFLTCIRRRGRVYAGLRWVYKRLYCALWLRVVDGVRPYGL